METPTAIPPIPRLRVSRQHQSTIYDYSGSVNFSEAGPSRLHISTNLLEPSINMDNADDDDHEENTPKLPSVAALPNELSSTYPADTPAARLKAVLERTSAKSRPPPAPIPSSASTTDFESDFDIPTIGSSQPSLARETLNSLFSHALREPGDTPQKSVKGRLRRRNSIDTSEFESNPRASKIKNSRAEGKGKRRSLSDDELSSSNISIDRSQAAVFDTLRQRLDSGIKREEQVEPSTTTNIDPDDSLDTLKFSQELNNTPPAATSTPQHSWFNSRFQSNLLDVDSEMQQAMRDLDSYEHSPPTGDTHILKAPRSGVTHEAQQKDDPREDSESDRRISNSDHLAPEKSPSNRIRSSSRGPVADTHQREREWNKNPPTGHTSSTDINHRHSFHISREINITSTSSSSSALQKHSHHTPRMQETEQVAVIESRQTNTFPRSKPRPLSMPNASLLSPSEPARMSSIPTRPGSRLSTSSPQASFHGQHSRSSSRASSSAGSFSNIDGGNEKSEIDHERERNWNAPRPHWHQQPTTPNARPSSRVGVHSLTTERVRTLSFPTRPDSRLSTSSPRLDRQRQASYGSSQSSSRASSRASSPPASTRSFGSVDADKDILHEQERNWNSPRPQWNGHSRSNSSGHGHSTSPTTLKRTQSLTQKSSPSPSSSTSSHFSMDTSASARRRTESLKSYVSPPMHHKSSLHDRNSPKPEHASPSFHNRRTSLHNPPRPNSPLPPLDDIKVSQGDSISLSLREPLSLEPKPHSTSSSHQAKSPSLSREMASPSPSPSQRKSAIRSSQIPVRALSRTTSAGTVLFPHTKRTDDELHKLDEEVTSQIPSLRLELVEDETEKPGDDKVAGAGDDLEVEEEHQFGQENTPTMRPNTMLPPTEDTTATEAPSIHTSFESKARLRQTITSPPSPPLSPPSDGPSTPEGDASHSMFSFPSTPPRKEHHSTKLEYKTPSPPKNLPDLPGPPSLTLSDDEDHDLAAFQRNLSNLKTPKPPGGWTTTPLTPRSNALLRSNSLPTDDETDSGLATPAASLSRAASLPPQTPALPGGWMNTPAKQKSVRFHEESVEPSTDVSCTELVLKSEDSVVSPGEHSLADSRAATTFNLSSTRTPSQRKANSIRIVDAFGREEKKIGSSKNNSIRIVDAMGRAVEDSMNSNSSNMKEHVPPSRQEALDRVRSGLHDLVEELKDEEGLIHITHSEDSRHHIRRLEKVSQDARLSRVRLSSEMFSNVENIKTKLAPLRASMQHSTASATLPAHHRSTGKAWLLWALIQILITYAMYRAAIFYARKTFFTTYYDPLYPDLFFYTLSPTNYCSSPSIYQVLQQEGFKAAIRQVLAYLAIFLSSWQSPCQWQGSYQVTSAIWPPT
ncbi:hypothetical protein EV361DRAFT_934035 [Lentinula raphanica]|nr:hypothetical protein EV361DRAFT_934035 [Lentinula raphanica]